MKHLKPWQEMTAMFLVAPLIVFVIAGYWIGCAWVLVSLLEWAAR